MITSIALGTVLNNYFPQTGNWQHWDHSHTATFKNSNLQTISLEKAFNLFVTLKKTDSNVIILTGKTLLNFYVLKFLFMKF